MELPQPQDVQSNQQQFQGQFDDKFLEDFQKVIQNLDRKPTINLKEIHCYDCRFEFFQIAKCIPKQLSCGHVTCEDCFNRRRHRHNERSRALQIEYNKRKKEGKIKEDLNKRVIKEIEKTYKGEGCGFAHPVPAPYLNAHINNLIKERNASLKRVVCSKHPQNEAHYYEQFKKAFVCSFCIDDFLQDRNSKFIEISAILKANQEQIKRRAGECIKQHDDAIHQKATIFNDLSNHYLSKVEEISMQEESLIQYIKQCSNNQINTLLQEEAQQRENIQKELEELKKSRIIAQQPFNTLNNANQLELLTNLKYLGDTRKIGECQNRLRQILDSSKMQSPQSKKQKVAISVADIENFAYLY